MINWAKIFSSLENEGMKINNFQYENNAYLLKLTWNFAYSNKPWSFLLKAKVVNLSISSAWLIDPFLFGLGLNSFMTLFLSIPLGL